ncbi:hypothetical protein [Laspinema palackyanum]|uniref:hypothetical protein n=1 Tax=Laspinema palackyanum TaxID=3231601 RepID=UPI00345C9FFE
MSLFWSHIMIWLFSLFFVLLLISATPLLGTLKVRWSFEIMVGLFAFFAVAGWGLFLGYSLLFQ